MAFGGCVPDDSEYDELFREINKRIYKGEKNLVKAKSEEDAAYWAGYLAALEDLV